jgi:hypothetical protein
MGRYLRLADQVGQRKQDLYGTVTELGKKSVILLPSRTGETADARNQSGYDKDDINDQRSSPLSRRQPKRPNCELITIAESV